jgi:hypothetical protein
LPIGSCETVYWPFSSVAPAPVLFLSLIATFAPTTGLPAVSTTVPVTAAY